jgi:hypothetical protein
MGSIESFTKLFGHEDAVFDEIILEEPQSLVCVI